MSNTILEVKDLQKEYAGEIIYKALKGIDFHLDRNEFVAVMYPSGSGKTTFRNCRGKYFITLMLDSVNVKKMYNHLEKFAIFLGIKVS
ncbi:hypothetical protein [Bacillus sp. GM_Baccil_2]|uniref:hypothetical protein n=1 Tax=Bacillus sp. GM_Baccil_2 TaxID=2937369 RepID=UPI00226ABACC